MAFKIYRLSFSDPLQFYEQFGDPVTSTGGAPVPALRGALRHSVSVATFTPNVAEDTITNRLKLRRQWRSLVNNTPMKLQGLFLGWEADPENNGWYMPDQGQLQDLDGSIGLATGVFKVEGAVWILAGRPRTHRRAMWIYMKDLRAGLYARDYRRQIYVTDFAAMTALSVSYFPPGSYDLVTTGGAASQPIALTAGADGGACLVTSGLIDEARASFEQPLASVTLGTVVVYDRRGEQNGPTTGPGASWEEFFGVDYPYSWTEGFIQDVPVIENGRCRVRYDSAATPGFRIDVWTGSAWEEQGKLIIGRINGGTNPFLNTLVSASVAEYSETRVVVQCVLRSSIDVQSREEVFITLQRGWSGPRFEVYTSPKSNGEVVDAYFNYNVIANDSDDSAIKVDAAEAGGISATAKGTGHTGKFAPEAGIGAPTFTGENWVSLARWGATYGVHFAASKASNATLTRESEAYGSGGSRRNAIQLEGSTKDGYLSWRLGFYNQVAQQALEAESMTLGTGTTSVADAEASGGKASQAKRTTDANPHVSTTNWPNGAEGSYRIFARVKATSGKLKIYAKVGTLSGATKEVTAAATPTYTWVDLGELLASQTTLEIHAWQSASVNFQVDRIEAFLTEDRASLGIYEGARDLGAGTLYDSRVIPTLVSRST